MRGFGTQFVGQQQRPDDAALDRDKHHERRPPRGAADDAQSPVLRLAVGVDQIARTGTDVLAVDDTVNAGAHGLVYVARQRQRQAAIKRGLHHGSRQHMMRRLLQRRADLQHTLGCLAGSGFDRQQTRAADRQRSGLVEQDCVRAGQRLQRGAALHQDAAAGGLCDTGNEGDRRRENERTRRCGDKHGEAPDKIAGNQPGGGSEQDRHRQKNNRKPVGKADERRLRGLCRRHHMHDTP